MKNPLERGDFLFDLYAHFFLDLLEDIGDKIFLSKRLTLAKRYGRMILNLIGEIQGWEKQALGLAG